MLFTVQVAIKVIDKTDWPDRYSAPSESELMIEVDILKSLDHPGITKIFDGTMEFYFNKKKSQNETIKSKS